MKTYTTTKLFDSTLQRMRLLRALTGEPGVNAIDRLIKAELERVKREGSAGMELLMEASDPGDNREN